MSFSVETQEIRIIDQIKARGFDSGKTEQLLNADLIILPAGWDINHKQGSFTRDVSDFQKIVRKKYPEIKIAVFGEPETETYQELRSDDIYLQTLYWFSDIGKDIVVSLISYYLIHRARGIPKNENQNLRFVGYEENRETGITKRYYIDGPACESRDCIELLMGKGQAIPDEKSDE